MDDLYLGPDVSGVAWVLDPASAHLAELARELDARTPEFSCDPMAVAAAGLHIALPTKHNNFGEPVEMVGFPVDIELDPTTPLGTVAARFDAIHGLA